MPLHRALTGSLRRKILLTNGVVLIFMIGASHLLTYLHWRKQLLSFAQQEGWVVASMAARHIHHHLDAGDIDGVRVILDSARNDRAVESVFLTNEKGLVLISPDTLEQHRRSVSLPDPVRGGRRTVSGSSRLTDETRALSFYIPIQRDASCRRCHYDSAPEMAVLQMTLSTEHLVGVLHSSSLQVVLITILTIGLLIVALLLLFRTEVNRPVSDILAVMQQVKAGKLDARARVRSRDEMGMIASELNLMLEQLQSARAELQSLYRRELERQERLATIGNLASAVAHEIKNPLAGIRGGMEVIEQSLAADDQRREMTRAIVAEVDRINRMVRDLLAYSRKPEPQTVATCLNDVVEDVLTQARQLSDAGRIEVVHESADEVPNVAVDYQLIKQAFLNIIQNAFDAMPGGGRLRIRTWGDDARAFVAFTDTGNGISAETAPKILQPFFTTRHRGTGLGLPIALSIVQAHQGELTFESRPGGTTFTISFPALPGLLTGA